jgi:hypothetical protein
VNRSSRKLTRHQLFDLVWRRPISQVAPQLGISGVGLGKLCRRFDIPVPERGYWARLRFGKKVKRPRLPPTPVGQSEKIVIEPSRPGRLELEGNLPPDVSGKVEAERAATEPIKVPHSPTPHPIVEGWKSPTPSPYGASRSKPSPGELRRRRIATVLFREIEKRGGKISAKDPYRFEFTILGEKLEVSFHERTTMVKISPDPRSSWSYERTEYQPNGLLRLRIENYFDVPVRREFNETEAKPLEGKLREVMIALFVGTAAERQRRLRLEEEARQWHLAEIRRWEREERRRKEEARVKELIIEVDAWAQANRIREFVAAVEGARKADGSGGPRVQEWATWARGVADEMDPAR